MKEEIKGILKVLEPLLKGESMNKDSPRTYDARRNLYLFLFPEQEKFFESVEDERFYKVVFNSWEILADYFTNEPEKGLLVLRKVCALQDAMADLSPGVIIDLITTFVMDLRIGQALDKVRGSLDLPTSLVIEEVTNLRNQKIEKEKVRTLPPLKKAILLWEGVIDLDLT